MHISSPGERDEKSSNAIASHPQLQKEKGEGTDTYLGRGTLFLFHIQGCRLLPLDLWLREREREGDFSLPARARDAV